MIDKDILISLSDFKKAGGKLKKNQELFSEDEQPIGFLSDVNFNGNVCGTETGEDLFPIIDSVTYVKTKATLIV